MASGLSHGIRFDKTVHEDTHYKTMLPWLCFCVCMHALPDSREPMPEPTRADNGGKASGSRSHDDSWR